MSLSPSHCLCMCIYEVPMGTGTMEVIVKCRNRVLMNNKVDGREISGEKLD